MSEEIHSGEERPTKKTLCGTLKTEANLKCLILTTLIYGCVVAIIYCRITRVTKVDIDFTAFPITSTRQISPCDDGYIYIPTAFVIMLYLLYLVECWHCKARIQLSFEKTDVNTVYRKVEQIRAAQPMVWWKAVCYHYIRRTKQVTRYRNGDAYTSTQVYYERVNSHAAAGCFFYALCGMKDISKELLDLEKHAATKIRFSKGFLFANVPTSTEFQEQRSLFFEVKSNIDIDVSYMLLESLSTHALMYFEKEQERFDDYMEMREGLDLSNVYFKENMIAWATPDNLPWFAKTTVFWICSFLLLSWPLRIILELNTAHVHYQVNKLFGVNYASPHEEHLFRQNFLVRNHNGGYRNRRLPAEHLRTASRVNSNRSTVEMSGETEPLLSVGDEDEEEEAGKKKLANKSVLLGCQQLYANNGRLPRSVTLLMTKPEHFEFFESAASVNDRSLGFKREDNSVSVHFNNYFYSYYSTSRDDNVVFRDGEGSSQFSTHGLAPSYSEALLLMEPNTNATEFTTSTDRRNTNTNMDATSQPQPQLVPTYHYQSRNSLHIADGRDNCNPHQPNLSEPLPSVQSHLLQVDSDRNRPRNTHNTVYSSTNTNNGSEDPYPGDETTHSRRASESNGDCGSFNNFSSSRRHFQRRLSSSRSLANSSTVLDTLAPRGMTGVQIDLTQPVVVSVPRDNHRTGTTQLLTTSESPPTYEEALRTSRPVFLPALAALRRCLTERDIARGFTTNMWLNNVNPTFLQRFTVPPLRSGSGNTYDSGGNTFTSNSSPYAARRSDCRLENKVSDV